MSKIILSITNLTLTIEAEAPRSSLGSALLAALMSNGGVEVSVEREENGKTGTEPAGETAASTAQAAPETAAPVAAEATTGYVAAEPAPTTDAAPTATGPSELTYDTVLAFLKSDERYGSRTFEAIRKHFNAFDHDDVENMLDDMESDDEVIVKTRRSDRAKLYAAA